MFIFDLKLSPFSEYCIRSSGLFPAVWMCSETLACKIQTPGNYPEEYIKCSFCQNLILISIRFKMRHKIGKRKYRSVLTRLILNWLISNDLVSIVYFGIKLYIGVQETSLCLRPLYWERVEVTHMLILLTFIISSAKRIENLMQITDVSHSWIWFGYITHPLIGSYISCCLTNSWILEFHLDLMFETCNVIKWQLNCSLAVLVSTLQYRVTIMYYQLTHCCPVMLLFYVIYVSYEIGFGGINIKNQQVTTNEVLCVSICLFGMH